MHISNLNIKVVNGIRRFYNIDSQVKSFKRKFVADEPLRLLKKLVVIIRVEANYLTIKRKYFNVKCL